MTDTPLTPQELEDALAAEYVLGVLDIAERMAVETRIKQDQAFAERVRQWELRLSPLNTAFEEVAPSRNLLPEIEARLFPKPPRRELRLLPRLAGAFTVALLVFGLALFLQTPPQGEILAELGASGSSLVYEVRHDGGQITASRRSGAAPAAGQAHELWIIAPGAAPVSLGLLGEAPLRVEYPRPPAGWVLAVSVEPSGGSPTGAPTGPVILMAEIGA